VPPQDLFAEDIPKTERISGDE